MFSAIIRRFESEMQKYPVPEFIALFWHISGYPEIYTISNQRELLLKRNGLVIVICHLKNSVKFCGKFQ